VGNSNLPAANFGHPGEPTTALKMVNNDYISPLFVAAADAVEERYSMPCSAPMT
jgi:hypothetical protein